MSDSLLVFYAIQNSDGKYYRAIGHQGYGAQWVDDLVKARIYARKGPARSIVTYYANAYPKKQPPMLVELHVTKTVIVDETERVQKAKDKKIRDEQRKQKNQAQWELEAAQRKLEQAQKELDRLGK